MKLLATASLLGLSVLLAGTASAQSATFANYDKNGDGLLSRNEWAQLAESRNQKIFRKAAQGDRFITEDEFALVISDDDLARRLSALRDNVAAKEAADRVEDEADEAVKAEKKSQRELKAAEKRRIHLALKEEREALKEERKAHKKAENSERRAAREQSVVGDD